MACVLKISDAGYESPSEVLSQFTERLERNLHPGKEHIKQFILRKLLAYGRTQTTKRSIYYRKYVLQITQPSLYRYTQLMYRFAVISEAPNKLFIVILLPDCVQLVESPVSLLSRCVTCMHRMSITLCPNFMLNTHLKIGHNIIGIE